ncbi:ketosynthase chain-length factor [Streptomyces sp. NPDC050560]|uniref:ketosynthase chain-length factor n=1 Tax=Streptomyces sp. NPDC050560 TaxID=3365630 RepID=UPI0037BCA878
MSAEARAVVTGLGALAPNGSGTEEFWKATLSGRCGITPLHRYDAARYPVRLAGQILDFDAEAHVPGRLLPQTDRVTRLALLAAERALDDAGAEPGARADYDMGVITSNTAGGFEFTHREVRKLWTKGPRHVSVYESFAWFYAVNTGQISIRHGMRGPGGVLVGEQAAGLDALGHARRTVRGGVPLVVSGGMESALDPWAWLNHLSSGRVSAAHEPERAYRPFDADADGCVPGEGGAILVVEDEAAARARGAGTLYGHVAGYAATFDPPPGSARPSGLGRAARLALDDAGVGPGDVDVVFADAAGVPGLDREEAAVLRGVFGPCGVPVTAPKSLIGRLASGGPPLDVVAALLSIRDSVIPPTAHTRAVPPEYGLDLVLDAPRGADVRTALVLARGFGGFNAAVVLRKVTP